MIKGTATQSGAHLWRHSTAKRSYLCQQRRSLCHRRSSPARRPHRKPHGSSGATALWEYEAVERRCTVSRLESWFVPPKDTQNACLGPPHSHTPADRPPSTVPEFPSAIWRCTTLLQRLRLGETQEGPETPLLRPLWFLPRGPKREAGRQLP